MRSRVVRCRLGFTSDFPPYQRGQKYMDVVFCAFVLQVRKCAFLACNYRTCCVHDFDSHQSIPIPQNESVRLTSKWQLHAATNASEIWITESQANTFPQRALFLSPGSPP